MTATITIHDPIIEMIIGTLQEAKATIKTIDGIFLAQRDGNPIASAGVYLSRDEFLGVGAGTAALYNACMVRYGDLILID